MEKRRGGSGNTKNVIMGKIRSRKYNEIENIISLYFNIKDLKRLDSDNNNGYYTGVTLKYIVKYVIKNKYQKKYVWYVLMKMLHHKEIRMLFCNDVMDLVFEPLQIISKNNHWTYSIEFTKKGDQENLFVEQSIPETNIKKMLKVYQDEIKKEVYLKI